MAAGLPVVVSDWDGYKDTVRDGIDGFRVPTLMPPPGMATDLAMKHALEIETYDMYCGHTSSLVSVDIEAATEAFSNLFKNDQLRKQMGDAGKLRAKELYDWSAIIPQYEELWSNQKELRHQEIHSNQSTASQNNTRQPLTHPWPARMDPFDAFSSYPTSALSATTTISLADNLTSETAWELVRSYSSLAMVSYAKKILPSEDEVKLVLLAAVAPDNALAMVKAIQPERQAFDFRSLAWLLKLGVLKVIR